MLFLPRASLLLALIVAVGWSPDLPVHAAPGADAASALVVVDQPRGGTSGTLLLVSGWAADPGSSSGTGIETVEIYLDGEREAGGTLLGRATYGLQRADVAANLGSTRFALTGFALQTTVTPGPHTVYVYARTTSGELAGGAPKAAAVVVNPGPIAGGGYGEIPVWTQVPTSITSRSPGVAGSYTFEVASSSFPYYPPGPADTGGPVYAPVYYGLGRYGGVLPFPDYPAYSPFWSNYAATGWLTGLYDWGYSYGGSLPASTYFPYGSGYGLDAQYYPNYYRRSWRGYLGLGGYLLPAYCPVYTNSSC